jgi:hypothetical protein
MGILGVFPRLNNFLCCIELQMGTVIIGILLLMFHGINFARYITGFVDGGYNWQKEWPALLLYTLGLILALYLLLGAIKRNAGWISGYLYFTLVFIVYTIVVIVIDVVNGHKIGNYTDKIVLLVVEIYFWLCVNSYYQALGGD